LSRTATASAIDGAVHGHAKGGAQSKQCKREHRHGLRLWGGLRWRVRDDDLNVRVRPKPYSGECIDVAMGLGRVSIGLSGHRDQPAYGGGRAVAQPKRAAGCPYGRGGREHVGKREDDAG